jgi:hypothetical protein
MKRIFGILMVALCMVAMMLVMAAPAFAQGITVGPGGGNPETNPTGKCPPGQNTETSPGGLKKCP